jgi:prophage regulatory protein
MVSQSVRNEKAVASSAPLMSSLPDDGFLRIAQIIGDKKANPAIMPLIPIGKSSWWMGIKQGRFPKPLKLGPKTTVWRIRDIRKLIEQ